MREASNDVDKEVWREWILTAIGKIRSQKQRPSVQRICQAIGSHHKFHEDIVAGKLEEAVSLGTVLKVYNHGLHSYKAPVARRRIIVSNTSNLTLLVTRAVRELGECDGSNINSIENHVQNINEIKLVQDTDFKTVIKKSLKNALNKGLLVQEDNCYKIGVCTTTMPKKKQKQSLVKTATTTITTTTNTNVTVSSNNNINNNSNNNVSDVSVKLNTANSGAVAAIASTSNTTTIGENILSTNAANTSTTKRMYSKLKFTVQKEDKVINFVKNNEHLYDIRNPNYGNTDLVNSTWSILASKLDCTVDECIQKWKSIRDCYIQRRNSKPRIRSSLGNRRDENLSFLDSPSNSRRSSQCTTSPEQSRHSDELIIKEEPILSDETMIFTANDDAEQSVNSSEYTIQSTNLSTSISHREEEQLNEKIDFMCKLPIGVLNNSSPLDHFFRSMCETTKIFPRRKQVEVKMKIIDVITQTELQLIDKSFEIGGYMDNPSPSSIMHKDEEQWQDRMNSSPLDDFFRSMRETTKTFPPRKQVEIKMRITEIITQIELQLIDEDLGR